LQKDMRSPSGGKARRRGGTQSGKALQNSPSFITMILSALSEILIAFKERTF